MKIPKHVAIILDGNGRWAKKRGMPRNYGHTMGAKNVEVICKAAHDLGIEYVTMYAFSTENWNRPQNEVDALMKLLSSYLKNCIKTADKNNMRVRVIGDTSRLDDKFQQQIAVLERESAHNTGLNLQIAINYGARDEMIRGMKKMWQDGISAEEITEEKYESYLDTKGMHQWRKTSCCGSLLIVSYILQRFPGKSEAPENSFPTSCCGSLLIVIILEVPDFGIVTGDMER